EYREVPWQTLVLITAGLIYLVSPVDAIPDFMPLIGFSDDFAVLSAVIISVGRDLEKFLAWEKASTAEAEVLEIEPESDKPA
ncbi:MAG TPA: YkvA family protein, partial [Desulfosporosinus sp.]|nr:YkvA family protein [Desulfosporosinus sp.]